MALDINGYNATFKAFADFAQQRVDADEAKAVVDARVKRLGNRKILAVSQSLTDEVHKWTRTNDEYAVNDLTRALFKKAIVNMFGGESKIPAPVRKAMLPADYGCGKPLTARRILAVKAAIDADGTAAARSANIRLETFRSAEVKTAALGMGYMASELPKLARTAHFYAEAKGVSEMDAMREVGRPGSEANRLMQYGGRFLESAENFADGLRLIAKFSEWHDGISSAHGAIAGKNPDLSVLDTPSKINAYERAAKSGAKLGLERFVFEDIASNPAFDLKETDAGRAFGVEHNPASRHMLVADNISTLGTIANMPPEKRRVVFAAFNLFQTLAPSAAERGAKKQVAYETQFLARILRHLPKLEALMDKRPLTGRDIVKTCFPDIRRPGNYDVDTIKDWEDKISDRYLALEPAVQGAISPMLEAGGATLDEALAALRRGKTLPTVPYYSDAQYSIGEASSFATSGIATMNGDIHRVSIYTIGKGENARTAFPTEQHAWKFAFPDGEQLETNGTKQDDIPRVGQKIRELCGEVHPKQIGTVAFLLSQSGTSIMKNQPLAKSGVNSDEHSPMDFTLSRDNATGAVTITYSSPKELPVRFSWTATVGVDGSVKSTPMVTEAPLGDVSPADAKKAIEAAAKDLGVKLSKADLNAAANLYAQHARGMYAKNANYLAHYIAKLPLSPVRPNIPNRPNAKSPLEKSTEKVAAFAPEIKKWESFGFGDPGLKPLEREVARHHNEYIAECLADPSKFGHNDSSIFVAFAADAGRQTFIINGRTFLHGTDKGGLTGEAQKTRVTDAFKAALPNEKARKALSVLMNQSGPGDFIQLSSHLPVPDPNAPGGVLAMHELGSADKLVNRNMMNGLNALPMADPHMTFVLDVSPDGNTAVVTLSLDTDLWVGDEKNNLFGNALVQQRITVNLAAETPTVTDVRFSQELR